MRKRRDHERGDADESQTRKQGIERSEKFCRGRMERIHRTHAAQNHRSVQERIDPAQTSNAMVSDYAYSQSDADGDRIEIRGAMPNQSRSTLGEFVYVQDAIIKEGLLGGALSTAWPLLKLDEHKAKLSYDGLKNIDGQQLYAVRYKPKKSTDLTIYLYFDPETYRHVRTVYMLTIDPHIKSVPGNILQSPERGTPDSPSNSEPLPETAEIASARQFQTRYRLEERFSNFSTVDGLTLPTHYTVQFAREQQDGRTVLSQWDTAVNAIKQNVSPDPRNFAVK